MNGGRLRNYPAHEFQTEDDWSEFFSNGIASTRVRVRSGMPIRWNLRVASVGELIVAYGSHASDIEIDQTGAGSGIHIHLPIAGRASLEIGSSGVAAHNEQATLVDLAQPHCLKIKEALGYKAIALNIPRRLINQQFAAVYGHHPRCQIDFQPTLGLATAAGKTFVSITNSLVTGLENQMLKVAPNAIEVLSHSLVDLLIQAWPHQLRQQSGKSPPQIAPRHVKRAIEFMRVNIGRPLSSSEIASVAGVSVRALEMGFRTFKDTTPQAYLRGLRLAGAREELSSPDSSLPIAEIAYQWGFTHLGRFAAMYRQVYGELPSETVAKRIV